MTRTISGMSHSLADLNRDYSLGDALLFVRGGGGMARAEVQTDACRAEECCKEFDSKEPKRDDDP